MPRRFLTVDDVRRAGGTEIVVAEGTVVTPQALAAAQAAGVTIRTGAGPYREPPPDRGPDAQRALSSLPHLPEPSPSATRGIGLAVTAVGRNRPGVLAEITAVLAAAGANVIDVSQKMVADFFHLVLTVELTGAGTFEELQNTLQALGGPDDFVVRVMHERVFRFMHRI